MQFLKRWLVGTWLILRLIYKYSLSRATGSSSVLVSPVSVVAEWVWWPGQSGGPATATSFPARPGPTDRDRRLHSASQLSSLPWACTALSYLNHCPSSLSGWGQSLAWQSTTELLFPGVVWELWSGVRGPGSGRLTGQVCSRLYTCHQHSRHTSLSQSSTAIIATSNNVTIIM